MSLQFFRLKCASCGSKFTITSDMSCNSCKFLGVPCSHYTLCLRCHKDSFNTKFFFATVGVIVLMVTHQLGGRI